MTMQVPPKVNQALVAQGALVRNSLHGTNVELAVAAEDCTDLGVVSQETGVVLNLWERSRRCA